VLEVPGRPARIADLCARARTAVRSDSRRAVDLSRVCDDVDERDRSTSGIRCAWDVRRQRPEFAYKLGRFIRLRRHELDVYIEAARVKPGDLRHLYPPGSSTAAAGMGR